MSCPLRKTVLRYVAEPLLTQAMFSKGQTNLTIVCFRSPTRAYKDFKLNIDQVANLRFVNVRTRISLGDSS
jgi:hypothetical protein